MSSSRNSSVATLPRMSFDLGRVLHARKLHVDAIQALALHDRLGHPQLIDAIAQRGDVLLDRVVLALLDLRGRQRGDDGGAAGQGSRS